jgi:hypothetical protein
MKKIFCFVFLIVFCVHSFALTGVVIKDRNSDGTLNLHNNAAVFIDYAHEKVHDGETYRVCTINAGVSNGDSLDLLIDPGSEIHLTGVVIAEGKSYDPDNTYLLRVTNVSGQAKDINANIQWYEDD